MSVSGVPKCQSGNLTMALDIAADNTTESADKVVDLARRSATDCVSDTNTVNTLLINSLVKAEKVDKITLLPALAAKFTQTRLSIERTRKESSEENRTSFPWL